MSVDIEQLSTQPSPPPQRPAHQRPLVALRRGWRVLTSMRTALLLLTLLAAASIPGSVIPQHSLDPSKVVEFQHQHTTLAPIYAKFDLFDVFHAPWYAAIYALLFISLIGCVIPRLRLHARALLRRPPHAPRNLARLPQSARWETDLPAEQVVALAAKSLRRRRFRVAPEVSTLSAEKGYLRESGNLLFHVALLCLLVAIGVGSLFGYKGSKLLIDGNTFTNSNLLYDTYKPGALTNPSDLDPFQVMLHKFNATYEPDGSAATFDAHVTAKTSGGQVANHDLRVNHPLTFGHTSVYLIGHGYALHVVLRDAKGNIWHQETVPCIPQDLVNYLSQCVVKAPDTGATTTRTVTDPQTGQNAEVPVPLQYGFLITFVPTAVITHLGVQSAYPAPDNPRAIVTAFKGNLGVDSGVPQSVYDLNTTGMTPLPIPLGEQFVTPGGKSDTIPLSQGFTLQVTGYTQWASLQVKDDPAKGWALVAAILLIAGLLLSLRVRRRRFWLRATPVAGGRTIVEAGGLARTDADDFAREFPRLVARLAGEIRPAAREDPECPST